MLPNSFKYNFPLKIFYEMKSQNGEEVGTLHIFFRDGDCLKLRVDQSQNDLPNLLMKKDTIKTSLWKKT